MVNIKTTILFFILCISFVSFAQDDFSLPAVGDIPLADKIQVTADEDDPTQSIIQGEVGAVFPNAFVVVQNRYTADRAIISATSNGDFATRLYGRNQTPYWITAFERFPSDEDIDSAIGTTVYGAGTENTFYLESDLGGHVPRYRIFGEVSNAQLSEDETLEVALNLELDITDDFPILDDLVFNLELQAQDLNGDVLETVRVVRTGRDIEQVENQLILSIDVDFESAFNNDVILYFSAYVGVADGELEPWSNSLIFGLLDSTSENESIRLPIRLRGIGQQDVASEIGLRLDDMPRDWASLSDTFTRLSLGAYSLESTLLFAPIETAQQVITGELQVQVTDPSGNLKTLEADIIQGQSRLDDAMLILSSDNENINQYVFDEYGDYQIVVNLTVGIDGVDYTFFQSFFLRIAEPLYLSPAMLLGTPLQVGDSLSRSGYVIPPIPAIVQINLTEIIESEPERFILTDQANEYGYFSIEPFVVDAMGVYELSYVALYEDVEGRLWSSLEMVTSAYVADSLLVNGQRGLNGYDGTQQAWFDTAVYPDDDRNAGRQPYFPFYAGDVAYVPDALDGGIAPAITAPFTVEDITTRLSVVSPNGQLRQVDDFLLNGDFGFNGDDTFNHQIGMGLDGIREGDYAFLFGGVGSDIETAIYGAMMIVEDDDVSARVLSPFLDKLTVFGQELDMFFVPTGIRPAQVLTLGETLSIVGQVAPTLPAELDIEITSPSGKKTQFADLANAVGYFYSSENDMTLDEIGRWTIDIQMRYQGETSAGKLERPYPQGSLSYDIYVVPEDNPPLGEAEFMTETRKVNQIFPLSIPEGWTEVRAFATVMTPSWILSQEELTVFPSGTSYTYNPTQLTRDYPNLELLETAEGNYVADVVTLTLVMTGLDENSDPAIRTRSYTMTHDLTYSYNEAMLR